MKPLSTPVRASVGERRFDVRVEHDGKVTLIEEGGPTVSMTVREIGRGEPMMLAVAVAPDGVADDAAVPTRAQLAVAGEVAWVWAGGEVIEVDLAQPEQGPARRRDRSRPDALAAPMPATVTRILVETGQRVSRGDTLVLLEAMKMEMPVKAPVDGHVSKIRCRVGEIAQAGEPLVDLEPTDSTTA